MTGITGNQAFLETPEVLAGIAGKMYLDMNFFKLSIYYPLAVSIRSSLLD